MSYLSAEYFHNEKAAFAYLESIVWANGVECPKCGSVANHYQIKGKTARIGLRTCRDCRKQFTVKVGTVFESSHVPLHKWLLATYLFSASKKGMSAHQLHRMIGVTYKTAWFMFHRLREAMRVVQFEVIGGEGKAVEADETFIGNKGKKPSGARGYAHKEKVFSLLERGGRVQSRHVPRVNADTLRPIMLGQIEADSRLMTDKAGQYTHMRKHFMEHNVVRHGIGEYVRGDIHTNTVEAFFSVFKRGMRGIYHHCSPKHLKRYLAEFDFRYNERHVTDIERTRNVLAGAVGKRMTYR